MTLNKGTLNVLIATGHLIDEMLCQESYGCLHASSCMFTVHHNHAQPCLLCLGRYHPKNFTFLPMSGLLGHNIKEKVPKNLCPWYSGSTLFELLDNADPLPRDPLAPFRMSVIDRYKDMGTISMGKSESGIVRKGDRLYVMPNKCAPLPLRSRPPLSIAPPLASSHCLATHSFWTPHRSVLAPT